MYPRQNKANNGCVLVPCDLLYPQEHVPSQGTHTIFVCKREKPKTEVSNQHRRNKFYDHKHLSPCFFTFTCFQAEDKLVAP